jgi:hypothetical protein
MLRTVDDCDDITKLKSVTKDLIKTNAHLREMLMIQMRNSLPNNMM